MDGIMWSSDGRLKHLEWIVQSQYCCSILRMFLGMVSGNIALLFSGPISSCRPVFSAKTGLCNIYMLWFGMGLEADVSLHSISLLRAWREAQVEIFGWQMISQRRLYEFVCDECRDGKNNCKELTYLGTYFEDLCYTGRGNTSSRGCSVSALILLTNNAQH